MQVADIIFIRNDKVLLVQQRKEIAKGLWSYPGGVVENGETIEQAVIREVSEELGVELVNPLLLKSYEITTPRGELTINTFTGELNGSIALKEDELSAYEWFSLDELESMKDVLRSPIVLEQAQDAFHQVSNES